MRHLLGIVVFTVATVSTVIWMTPLLIFTVLNRVIPIEGFRNLMTRWGTAMGENWASTNALLFGLVNRTRYTTTGLDGLDRNGWYLVIVNHQTWVDIIVLQTVFNRRIPFLKFFVKQELAWFPLLGLAFWALDMPFMKRHSKAYLAAHPEKKGVDLDATRRACEKYHAVPTAVLNFVEGTRYSPEKAARRDSAFEHLLPPRAGGVAVTLSAMGEVFDALLDVTLYYPDGVPTFWDAMCGRFPAVRVEVTRRAVEPWILAGDYENDREFRRSFHRWLTELWLAKDARLRFLNGTLEPEALAPEPDGSDRQPVRTVESVTRGEGQERP